ncbi:MAG: glutamate-5-semialdehyde dehydrogenase [Elusimicrobiota bacterium]|nr:glutamate-5-semialdehyde dehydrogenase [Elusimicrobiota bacterium]
MQNKIKILRFYYGGKMIDLSQIVKKAKEASQILSLCDTKIKNDILYATAQSISANTAEILFYNDIDVCAAKESGLPYSMLDRLSLNEKRVSDMAESMEKIASLPDPIGEIVEELKSSFDLEIKKIRVPLGVIALIYEARPNAASDAAALCLKSGNALILKGGSEAVQSNKIIAKIIKESFIKAGAPEGCTESIDSFDRNAVLELLKFDAFIDLIIPRGGKELVDFVKASTKIPVLSHGMGLCHLYIDKDADFDAALKIAVNAKCQRPSVCNSIETLLIHKDIAEEFLPKIFNLYKDNNVEMRGCGKTREICSQIGAAAEEDWDTEYHDLIISIKISDSISDAIEHINRHGSKHSDSIVTENKDSADKFLREIDSAAVFVNASTRLHDGSVFGLGCEIGISTQKLHSRGTMGLKELTATKFLIRGNGTIRQ